MRSVLITLFQRILPPPLVFFVYFVISLVVFALADSMPAGVAKFFVRFADTTVAVQIFQFGLVYVLGIACWPVFLILAALRRTHLHETKIPVRPFVNGVSVLGILGLAGYTFSTAQERSWEEIFALAFSTGYFAELLLRPEDEWFDNTLLKELLVCGGVTILIRIYASAHFDLMHFPGNYFDHAARDRFDEVNHLKAAATTLFLYFGVRLGWSLYWQNKWNKENHR
jgi:hypothetical protein